MAASNAFGKDKVRRGLLKRGTTSKTLAELEDAANAKVKRDKERKSEKRYTETLTKGNDFLKRTTYERYEPSDNDEAFAGLLSEDDGDSDDDATQTLSITASKLAAFSDSPGSKAMPPRPTSRDGGVSTALSATPPPAKTRQTKEEFQRDLKAQMALLLKEQLQQAAEGAYGKGGNSYSAPGVSPRAHEYYKSTVEPPLASINPPPPLKDNGKDNKGLRLSSLAKPLAPPEKNLNHNKNDKGYFG